jgi:hypothetical protein
MSHSQVPNKRAAPFIVAWVFAASPLLSLFLAIYKITINKSFLPDQKMNEKLMIFWHRKFTLKTRISSTWHFANSQNIEIPLKYTNFIDKLMLILYPRFRNSITHLKVMVNLWVNRRCRWNSNTPIYFNLPL